MVQPLCVGNTAKHVEFSNAILQDIEGNNFLLHLIFNDEGTFHMSSKVKHHIAGTWGFENSQEILEHYHDSMKVTVFSSVSLRKIYGPFFRKTQFQDKHILKC